MKTKTRFNKLTAWLLTLAMIFSMLPVSVFATEDIETDISETSTDVVCDCGTDDALIHATTCAVYVAPENPVCYCAEKCSDVNEWCDICGFDYSKCTGTDTAAAYAVGIVSTLEDLKAAIQNGGEYMLGDNIDVTGYLNVKTEVILHLNGKNITGDGEIFWVNTGTLTILGNGVLSTNNDDLLVTVSGEGASVNIAGGTFEGRIDVSMGTCEISGGQIKLLNAISGDCICEISGGQIETLELSVESNCTISGGTFGIDPTYFVDTANYTVTNNGDGTWTVTCNHIFGTDGKCTRCGAIDCGLAGHPGELENYTPTADGKHTAIWSCCGTTVTEPHSITAAGDRAVATCTAKAYCSVCNSEYGELSDHTPAEDATYTDNGNGTHDFTCSSCGNPFTERHTFTDGACTGCGVIGGYCGEEGNEQNVIWTYANGTLTISGTGAIADQHDNYDNRPWEEYVDQITTIVVNDGITSIGEAAFGRFQKLTTAKLPDSLTTISQQAFYGCTALKTVNFPANLKTIEGWAFLGCALESITLPEGLTTIGYRAFSECKNLTSVTVPASVTTIDEGAFGYSPAKITVAEDNPNYSSDEHGVLFDKDKTTLIYCRPNIEVETYTIPSTVTEICKEAFYGCKNLATITIPDGVQKIGSSAFGGCEALTTITIPAGVITIEANTFYDCTALTAVTIPAGVTTIDMWAFSACTALTTVTIPASVTSIAYNAFSNCSALTTVNVPCTWDGSLYTFDESVLNKVHNWVGGACTVCGVPCDHKDSTHTTATNNGDGTHSFECSVCNTAVTEDHTATYSASGKVITESCSKCKADLGTATISAENATYNGTEQKTATVDYSEGWRGGELTVSYENNTNAGTATASITLGEGDDAVTARVDFTIAKATISNVTATVTAPEAGAAPQTTITAGAGFSAEIKWNETVEKFGFNTAYTATVTLTTDSNHKFADNLNVDGWNVAHNSDNTVATLTKTFDATRKQKIESVTVISNVDLDTHKPDAASVIATLPTTVSVALEENGTDELAIVWSCDHYKTTPLYENTFTWIATNKKYNSNDVTLTGEIKVKNPAANAVTITVKTENTSVIYNASDVDLTSLFDIDLNAGDVTYTVTNETGAGTQNGTALTVTKAGTFTVKVDTAASGIYAAGTQSATLTVEKANGTGTVSMDGWTYGETAKAPAISDNKGEATYQYKARGADDSTYSSDKPSNAGEYTVKATFAETDLYNETSATADFTIAKVKVTAPEADATVFTYNKGEQTYTLATSELYEISNNTRTDAGSQDVVVSLKDKNNYEWSDGKTDDLPYTFTIAKAQAVITVDTTSIVKTYGDTWELPTAETNFGTVSVDTTVAEMSNAGEYTVTYTVAGNENYNGDTKTVSVKINPKKIDKASADNTSFVYDGNEHTYNVATSDYYTITGNKMTNAGSQTVTVALKDKVNYTWNDGKTDDVTFTFTIAKKDITGATVGNFEEITYTGGVQTPFATVTIDGLIVTGTWSDVTNVADKTTFTANGNFTGTIADKETGMLKANSSVATVSGANALTYSETAQELVIAGVANGGTLKYSLDNTTWVDAIPTGTNADTYEVWYKVFGDANHNDTEAVKVDVLIEKKSIEDATVALAETLTYNGAEQIQNVTVTLDGFTVTFDVTGENKATNVKTDGNYTLKVTANGNFEGEKTLEWNIAKADHIIEGENIPTASRIRRGNKLSTSTIAPAELKDADGNVLGTFTWVTPDDEMTETGDFVKQVKFTPTDTNNYNEKTFDVTVNVYRPSSGGGSSSNTTTTTTKNEDGSTTKTTTNKSTGTVTEVTTNTDGSTTTVETKKDGTVTTTEKDKDGNTVTTVEKPDGTSTTTEKNKDGSEKVTEEKADGTTVTTEKDADGTKTVTTENADGSTTTEETKKDGTKVTTETNADGETTAEVEAKGETEVVIPVDNAEDVTSITVTDKDGKETEITDFEITEDGVKLTVSEDCTVTLIKGEKKEFADVHPVNHWAIADVDYAYIKGLMMGTSETHFSPDVPLTRAMLVTVLYRLEGEPKVSGITSFADLEKGQYYLDAVCWAQINGIVNGTTDTTFAPNDNITREQIAAIMHRYAQYKGYDVSVGENTNILSYDDFDNISEYAIASMQYAAGSGLMKGKTTSTLNPLDNATRAEIAAILHRFIEANK